jgi:hypothetical protein
VIYLVGPSGAFKTELAALCQQHFGTRFNARSLPGNWHSTANATEGLAFAAKDMLIVVDDFAPSGSQADVSRLHRDADRIIRGVGNHAGRQRMRADGTLRAERPARSLILSTGEDVPRGFSLRGRLGLVEVSKGDVPADALTKCQHDASEGYYAQATAAYLGWLARDYDTIRVEMRDRAKCLREQYQAESQHARTPGIRAELMVGWEYFLHFAVATGAITEEESQGYRERVEIGLLLMASAQVAHQKSAEPVEQFLTLLRNVIASGRGHVAAPSGCEPKDHPEAWGWRKEEGYQCPTWAPQGKRLGWTEEDDLYLLPDAAHAEAQRLSGEKGESLPISATVLGKRLKERDKLKVIDQKRQVLTVRKSLEGKRVDVWIMHTQEVCSSEETRPTRPEDEKAF